MEVSINSIKRQLRMEIDDDIENEHLNELKMEAIEMLSKLLNRPLIESDEDEDDEDGESVDQTLVITPVLRRGILMLVSDLYENRGSTSVLTLNSNPAFQHIVDLYRVYPNGN